MMAPSGVKAARRGALKMPNPLAERHCYKGVECGVQPDGPNKWKWGTYPKIGSGITAKRGKASTQNEAVAACKAAIEQAFQKRTLR
jgi:hypothetical protein